MKRFLLLSSLAMFIIIGCNKHNFHYPSNIKQKNTTINNDYLYDEIYEIRDGKEIDLTHQQVETKSSYKFYNITVMEPVYCFLGSVFKASSINDGEIAGIVGSSLFKDSITVSFSLPISPIKVGINKSQTAIAINHAVHNKDFSGKQSQLFSYKMKNITHFSQIKIAFGANVNIGDIFSIDVNVNSGEVSGKTCLMADMSQIYFSAYMDFPYDGNIFKTEEIRQKYLPYDPIYIGTLHYGRKAVLLAESSYSYKDLSVAIRSAFKAKIINGELSLDTKTKNILTNTIIKICIIGPSEEEAYETINGFEEFQEYVIKKGVYTNQSFGALISFSGIHASDNRAFYNKFNIN